MNIPKLINFSGTTVEKTIKPDTKEYAALQQQKKENWKSYVNEMLARGVSVTYNVGADTFIVKPTKKPVNLKEFDNYGDDEDIDVEADIDDIYQTAQVPEEEEEEVITEPTTPAPIMQVVSLDDVLKILDQVNAGPDALAASTQPALQGGDEALKSVYFQGDGNETADSEFKPTDEKIKKVEDKIDNSTSYVASIDGLPDKDVQAQTKLFNTQLAILGIDADEFDAQLDQTNGMDTEELLFDDGYDFLSGANEKQPARSVPAQVDEPGIEQILMDDESSEAMGEDVDDQIMEDLDFPDDEYPTTATIPNADQSRFLGTTADEEEMPGVDSYIVDDEEEMPMVQDTAISGPVSVNKNEVLCGMPVQIVLTGVVIAPAQIEFIAESVKKSGNKLKAIKGKGDELQIVIEANKRQYTINYNDNPFNPALPFSIKHLQFNNLNEALKKVTGKDSIVEQKMFKQIVNKDLAHRNSNNLKESDIFNIFDDINYVSSWSVKNVGSLNLKNGLNETYSNITRHGEEYNTLVKNESGQFFLLKGNLKENSKKGTVKELVDINGKKSYGIAKVVGIFENSEKGLGKIMYAIQRTSIPLLVWK